MTEQKFNLACAMCGYDLAGMLRKDRCPECGRSVAWSMGIGRLLRRGDPDWLESIARGLQFVRLSARLGLAVPALLAVLGGLGWMLASANVLPPWWQGLTFLIAAGGPLCAAFLFQAWGCILLGQKPAFGDAPPLWASFTVCVAGPLMLPVAALCAFADIAPVQYRQVIWPLVCVWPLTGLAACSAMGSVVTFIGERTPDWTAQAHRRVRWGQRVSGVVCIVGFAAAALLSLAGIGPGLVAAAAILAAWMLQWVIMPDVTTWALLERGECRKDLYQAE